MIIDLISRMPLYAAVIPEAEKIARAFDADSPADAPCEVRQKAYAAKPDDARRFEVHFHTIDLMMAQEGAEIIHICPQSELSPAEDLPDGADGRKLNGAPRGTAALLQAGYFCALFPGEAHMVGGRAQNAENGIRKWVVKVPCAAAFFEDANK